MIYLIPIMYNIPEERIAIPDAIKTDFLDTFHDLHSRRANHNAIKSNQHSYWETANNKGKINAARTIAVH